MFAEPAGFPVKKGRSSPGANIIPMPIFEYACNQCQNRFEMLLRRSDQEVDCPQCHSADLRKLFSTFASPGASDATPDFCPPGGCGSCQDAGFCAMNN